MARVGEVSDVGALPYAARVVEWWRAYAGGIRVVCVFVCAVTEVHTCVNECALVGVPLFGFPTSALDCALVAVVVAAEV